MLPRKVTSITYAVLAILHCQNVWTKSPMTKFHYCGCQVTFKRYFSMQNMLIVKVKWHSLKAFPNAVYEVPFRAVILYARC